MLRLSESTSILQRAKKQWKTFFKNFGKKNYHHKRHSSEKMQTYQKFPLSNYEFETMFVLDISLTKRKMET